jgi:hypothetical protein
VDTDIQEAADDGAEKDRHPHLRVGDHAAFSDGSIDTGSGPRSPPALNLLYGKALAGARDISGHIYSSFFIFTRFCDYEILLITGY